MATRPGLRRKLDPGSAEALVRAKVKRVFGYCRVRCRGLAKNTERLALLLGMGNLMTAQRHQAA